MRWIVVGARIAGDAKELLLLNLHRYFGVYGANFQLKILPSSPQAGGHVQGSPNHDEEPYESRFLAVRVGFSVKESKGSSGIQG